MIRVNAAAKFRSQTGAIIALTLPSRFPFAYKLDGVWYEGMYRPAGFLRTPTSAKVARELDELSWCGHEMSEAMPAIVGARVPWWAKPTTTKAGFRVNAFCSEKCHDTGRCQEAL